MLVLSRSLGNHWLRRAEARATPRGVHGVSLFNLSLMPPRKG